MIEDVEGVHTELQCYTFSCLEVFVNSQVRLGEWRPGAISDTGRPGWRTDYIAYQRISIRIQPLIFWTSGGSARLARYQVRSQVVLAAANAGNATLCLRRSTG